MSGINGLILAGGKSSRYGSPKYDINFHGIPQKDFLFRLLDHFCDATFISGKREIGPQDRTIIDQYPMESPLNGILSAFKAYPHQAWLCIACDMPWVGPMAIQHLLSQRNTEKMATCYLDSDGKYPEPLLTLWEPKAYPALLDYYNNEGFSPRRFLSTQEINCIKPITKKHLFNVNTQKDHEQWQNN